MDKEQIGGLIEHLQSVRERPAMYVGTHNFERMIHRMIHFLHGFGIALHALSGEKYCESRDQVIELRGWELSGKHPCHQMLERGVPSQQVIDEIVTIEIEALQRLLT